MRIKVSKKESLTEKKGLNKYIKFEKKLIRIAKSLRMYYLIPTLESNIISLKEDVKKSNSIGSMIRKERRMR